MRLLGVSGLDDTALVQGQLFDQQEGSPGSAGRRLVLASRSASHGLAAWNYVGGQSHRSVRWGSRPLPSCSPFGWAVRMPFADLETNSFGSTSERIEPAAHRVSVTVRPEASQAMNRLRLLVVTVVCTWPLIATAAVEPKQPIPP